MTTIGISYELIAGHYLPLVPEGHKCRRPHGHNYQIDITIEAPVKQNGFIIDFYELQALIDQLDHTTLNDHEGLENPTAEVISNWFLDRIRHMVPDLYSASVRVWETRTCWALATAGKPKDFPPISR